MTIRMLSTCLFLFMAVAGEVFAAGVTLHVAPDGDDHADGSRRHPLRTINAARDLARVRGEQKGARIVLHDGDYFLNAPLELGAQDGSVVYEAARHATPRLIGGVRVAPEQFAEVADAEVLARLAPEARGKVLWADLAALGISVDTPYPDLAESPPVTPELFFGGERQTVSRWPNEGWAEVAEVVESGPAPWRNYDSKGAPVFRYDGDRPARWPAAAGVWLQGYWCFDWHIETVKIATIDANAHTITLAAQPTYGIGSGNSAKRRFVALNMLEELDMPGEYCLDWHTHRLYFWPPAALGSAETVLSRVGGAMVSLRDCSHVTLRGLTVEMGEDTGISVQGGDDVRLENCTVRNMGLQGVAVDGGTMHRVTGCEIYNTGTGGLRLAGGDRKTLTACGHRAEYNHIHHVGRRQRTHADHVDIAGVGVYFGHNLLHDGPHQSIYVAGNDHVIEYNEVHHVGMDSDDCGAYYMGRNPSERGNVVRYNYWHDIGSSYALGSCAIYLDDGECGQRIYGNVFYKAAGGTFGAIFTHGGHDNVAENNIFIDCKRPVAASAWGDADWKEWVEGDLWKQRLRVDVDITSDIYTSRYPELQHFYQWQGTPRRNRAVNNLFYHCSEKMNDNWDDVGNVSSESDPGFVNAEGKDFALKRRAEILKKLPGLREIHFDKIGLKR